LILGPGGEFIFRHGERGMFPSFTVLTSGNKFLGMFDPQSYGERFGFHGDA
jgi:hypothetical protein